VEIIKEHMVVDPAVQREIVARIVAQNLGDVPDQAVHGLGVLRLPDGREVALHVRHAADAILLDGFGQVVLITRKHHPGAGKLALPGGFIDEMDGVVEAPLVAARREAVEETGILAASLAEQGVPVGHRRFDRPFDIREAWNNIPGTNIKLGELFGVSTQGFCFKFKENLADIALQAGDDAAAVQVVSIAGLGAKMFAVPDHLEMILEACGVMG
jgi:8-oxo-dGTP pyrophosphatase MutT (NUDIX family)